MNIVSSFLCVDFKFRQLKAVLTLGMLLSGSTALDLQISYQESLNTITKSGQIWYIPLADPTACISFWFPTPVALGRQLK